MKCVQETRNFMWKKVIPVILIIGTIAGYWYVTQINREEPELYDIILEECNPSFTIIYDNIEYDTECTNAWGFGCIIELEDTTILFDTGGEPAVLENNIDVLDVDINQVEHLVVSHEHWDHVGGINTILETNNDLTVYLFQSFPYHVKSTVRTRGAQLVLADNATMIGEYAATTGVLGTGIEEHSLMINTPEGLIIVVGCSHPLVTNIVQRAIELTGEEVYLVIGGFHLGGKTGSELNQIVETMKGLGVMKVAPTHCSGEDARRVFQEEYGDDFLDVGLGYRFSQDN